MTHWYAAKNRMTDQITEAANKQSSTTEYIGADRKPPLQGNSGLQKREHLELAPPQVPPVPRTTQRCRVFLERKKNFLLECVFGT